MKNPELTLDNKIDLIEQISAISATHTPTVHASFKGNDCFFNTIELHTRASEQVKRQYINPFLHFLTEVHPSRILTEKEIKNTNILTLKDNIEDLIRRYMAEAAVELEIGQKLDYETILTKKEIYTNPKIIQIYDRLMADKNLLGVFHELLIEKSNYELKNLPSEITIDKTPHIDLNQFKLDLSCSGILKKK